MVKINNTVKIRPTTNIDGLLWQEFLQTVAIDKGIGKGVIQEALEEALQGWIVTKRGTENGSDGFEAGKYGMEDAVAEKTGHVKDYHQ